MICGRCVGNHGRLTFRMLFIALLLAASARHAASLGAVAENPFTASTIKLSLGMRAWRPTIVTILLAVVMLVIVVRAAELIVVHGVIAVVFPLKGLRHTCFRIVRSAWSNSVSSVVVFVSHQGMPLRLRIILDGSRTTFWSGIQLGRVSSILSPIIIGWRVVSLVSGSILLGVHPRSLRAWRKRVAVVSGAVRLVVLVWI